MTTHTIRADGSHIEIDYSEMEDGTITDVCAIDEEGDSVVLSEEELKSLSHPHPSSASLE